MDWQRVKEKVTAEVLRQLQAEGTAASPERVQQLVVAALGAVSGPTPAGAASDGTPTPEPQAAPCATAPVAHLTSSLPACEVAPDFKTDILIVVAGPVCDKVIGAIRTLAATRKVTVVSGGDSTRLAQVQACSQVLTGEPSETLARRLVQGAGTIVVPVITTSVAAKAAGLIGDCVGSAVLVQAALAGKRVIIARESLAAPADATWSIRRKVEEVSETLKTLGFAITNLTTLVAEVERAVGGGKAGSGGFVPAYQPHPAVLASRITVAENAAKAFALPGATPAPAQGDYDRELARMIDHTLLKPDATLEQVRKLCKEALEYGFWSVCINPTWVALCAKMLQNSKVKVCTVIGFPLGATSSASKAAEAAEAIRNGATEVDMVLNVGALKSGQPDVVLEDIRAVVKSAKPRALVKVILETGLLTSEEKVKACELAKQAGADFVKTSTGFGPGGATPEDIALMRKTVGPSMGVKASGGIRDFDTAQAVVKAGASRIGASASVNIVKRVKAHAPKDKY